jgi:hypothetical protein
VGADINKQYLDVLTKSLADPEYRAFIDKIFDKDNKHTLIPMVSNFYLVKKDFQGLHTIPCEF